MLSKLLVSAAALGVALALPAMADSVDQNTEKGEALAWTVAAYASCETPEELQIDYREEADRMDAELLDILESLRILALADNVCGNLNTYAMDLLALAEFDMAAVEARLLTSDDPVVPVFEVEEPEGAGSSSQQESLILTDASDLPPLSSSMPPSSDYQN